MIRLRQDKRVVDLQPSIGWHSSISTHTINLENLVSLVHKGTIEGFARNSLTYYCESWLLDTNLKSIGLIENSWSYG